MREPENDACFAIVVRQVSKSDHLDGTEEGHKPCVVIPGALILRIREVGMFQHLKILLDVGKWNGVIFIRISLDCNIGCQFAPIVPRRIVREVFVNYRLGYVTLLLKELIFDELDLFPFRSFHDFLKV